MMGYLSLTGSGQVQSFLVSISAYFRKKGVSVELPVKGLNNNFWSTDKSSATIGQLSFKKEAAGKLRVFALVDGWTQSVLDPLHQSLFRLLKSFPNDGTFDQDMSFKRAQLKASKFGVTYGYDLSSATDRLPIDLQVSILSGLFSVEIAQFWKTILVERDYQVPLNHYGIPTGSVRYSVGQPMGALSS